MHKVQKKVFEIVNANLENVEIAHEQMKDGLSALEMGSITFIHVIVALEEAFDIEIPDEYLLITEMNTLSKMTDVISAVLDHQNSAIGE